MFGQSRKGRITGDPDDTVARRRREAMVEQQIRARGIDDPLVLEAFRSVPRHVFVDPDDRTEAYADRALGIGAGQTISQPYIVALMTAALNLTPQSRVLEVGAGSGYQGAILATITPHVYTVEIVEELLESARQAWSLSGIEHINSKHGDGFAGWPEYAPYDAITVTCAPTDVPQPLKDQLKVGGRLCIPVGRNLDSQELVVLTKEGEDEFSERKLIPVRFVPMTGQSQRGP